jgi:hypothetical protein
MRPVAVSCISSLDGSLCITQLFASPGSVYRISPRVPTGRKIRKLEDRRIELHCLVQSDDLGFFFSRVAAEELPAVIIEIVCDVQYGLGTLEHLLRGEHATVARLIEWP